MKTFVSKSLLATCLCLMPAPLLHAAPDVALKISLNGYYQAKIAKSSSFLRGKVAKTRISTKQILKLISQESGRSIPSGSQLMVNPDGSSTVVDRKGDIILDSTQYVRVIYYSDTEIIDGVRNTDSGKEKSNSYLKIALALDLEGMSGTINGMAISENRISPPDRDGVQKWTVHARSQVNGRGEIKGGPGFYDGKINLDGRGATIE